MVLRAIVTLAAVATLGGCSWDRRPDVAMMTLLDERGAFNEAAYGAAIRARYPEGSSLKSFLGYIRDAKGECNDKEGGRLWCEIPTRGGFCWAQLIGLDVGVSQDALRDIKVTVGGLGC